MAIANVIRRGGTFHFRRVVPTELQIRLARTEMVRTLRTHNPRTAKLRAYELYVRSELIFETLRADPMLSKDQLAHLVQDFYEHVLDQENTIRLSSGAMSYDVRAARGAYYAKVAAQSKDALASNRLYDAALVTEGMLRRQGIKPADLDPLDLAKARQAMLRAGIDLGEAVSARYNGDFNYEPRDQLLKLKLDELPVASGASLDQAPSSRTAEPTTKEAASGPPLSEVGVTFRETQIATGAWDQQTAAQAKATFRLFVDVCGDKPIAAYTRRDAGLFRDLVQRLPSDYGKHRRYRDLSVDAILKAHSSLVPGSKKAPITQRTVQRHFSALSALWTAALPKGEVLENIFSGFRFTNSKKAADQRDMWERDELDRLFETPVWRGCESVSRRSKPGRLVIRDEKFWLPLIAVFSGLRQEEICQLHVEDVRVADDISYIDINNRPPRKLKNAAAIRHVPIHVELIKLGFLDYVEEHRRAGVVRIFPGLTPGGADGRLGHAFTKWFTRYRRDVGLYRSGLDFHSFRHTATTLMHQSGVERSVIDHVTGHTTPGETARYTKRSTLEQLKAAIDTIAIGTDLASSGGDSACIVSHKPAYRPRLAPKVRRQTTSRSYKPQ